MRPDFTYLCSRCAYRLGGRMPKDYVCTMHLGDCERCNEPEALAHVRSWVWPDRAQGENDRANSENNHFSASEGQ